MALTKAAIKQAYIDKQTALLGPPEDSGVQEENAEVMAEWLFEVLTNQAAVKINGVTGTGPDGGPLPITDQPGVIE